MRYETLRYLIFLWFPILPACEGAEEFICSTLPVPASSCTPIIPNIPNTAPTAGDVRIIGTAKDGELLTGNYIYTDLHGDLQGATAFRWVRNAVAIQGATNQRYTLTTDDVGFTIFFEVTPHAQSGPSPGSPVRSNGVGPVSAIMGECPRC